MLFNIKFTKFNFFYSGATLSEVTKPVGTWTTPVVMPYTTVDIILKDMHPPCPSNHCPLSEKIIFEIKRDINDF